MRNRTLALAFAAASVAACSRTSSSPSHDRPLPPDEAAHVLTERVWLDHLPRTQHDRFKLAVFDPQGIGVAQARTVWKGDFELFRFAVEHDRLLFARPATGEKKTRSFKVVRAEGGPADVKLVIDDNPLGPREYWGFNPDGGSADEWVKAHAPAKP